MESSVRGEVAAARAAWPSVAGGLPADVRTLPHAAIHTAAERTGASSVPALFREPESRSLTGTSAGIAGLVRVFDGLASRGWQMIGAAVDQIEQGPAASARFARANSPLYIQSVYDGYFSLAQVGKHLTHGYTQLGGPAAFGSSLTEAEVQALARAYSEPAIRLYPRPAVKLGG